MSAFSAEAPHSFVRKPFDLNWVYGYNPVVPILNLTNSAFTVTVAVASAHIVSIYSCPLTASEDSPSTGPIYVPSLVASRVQHLLGGHEEEIHTLDADESGRFLLSAAVDAAVIWDRQLLINESPAAIRHLDATFGSGGRIDGARISPDGRYVLLTGYASAKNPSQQLLQFWVWSAGRDEPDAQSELPNDQYGPVLAMCFNPFMPPAQAEFAITMSKNVLFGFWTPDANQFHLAPAKRSNKKTSFTMTMFCEKSHRPVTVSELGNVTIWSRPFGNQNTYAVDKTLHIGRQPLRWTGYVDEMVVVMEANGRLRFFDENLRIIFKNDEEHLVDIRNVSFDLVGRRYRLANPFEFDETSRQNQTTVVGPSQDEPPPEVLHFASMPKCTTVEANPFIVRNSIAVDADGRLLRCDLVQRRTDELCVAPSKALITTMDVSEPMGLISGGCSDGLVFLYSYVERQLVRKQYIPHNSGELRPITTLLFTKANEQLVIGIEPGELNVFDAVVLEPVGRAVHPTDGTVRRAVISTGGDKLAYCDSENTTVLLGVLIRKDDTSLHLIGKHRSHSDVITCLSFLGDGDSRLITYSEDRYLTEYDVVASAQQNELVMLRRLRYEQSARVTTAIWMHTHLMTCGSEFKVKLWHPEQLVITGTKQGPLLDGTPVRGMCLVPPVEGDNAQFLAFSTEGKTLGLQLLPFDGNAFRHVAMLAHPRNIKMMYALPDGKTLLTLGDRDCTIFAWTIRRAVVHENFGRGGDGLLPFCMALPGGRDGWLFREMQDMFYYMQIVTRSPDSPEEQVIQDSILLSDVADFLRGMGVFLSEFETNNMVTELSGNRPHLVRHIPVTFGELLKVYVNYRPAHGYAIDNLRRCMAFLSSLGGDTVLDFDAADMQRKSKTFFAHAILDRDQLIKILCTRGERMGRMEAVRYLVALLAEVDDEPNVEEIMSVATTALPPQPQSHHGAAAAGTTDDDERMDRMLFNIPEVYNMNEFLEEIFGLEANDESTGFSFLYEQDEDPSQLNEQLNNAVPDTENPLLLLDG